MRSIGMLLATIALVIQGCLFAQLGPPIQLEDGPRPVYVWNGEKCVLSLRSAEELAELENLSVFARRNGRIVALEIYGDKVPPGVVENLWAHGGTIDLSNGEQLTFPPGSKPSQTEIQSLMQAECKRTKEIRFHDIEFLGPLPEITTAK